VAANIYSFIMNANSGRRCYAAVLLLALALSAAGCAGRDPGKGSSSMTFDQVQTVMDRHAAELMGLNGVVGVSIGAVEDSSYCIQVMLREKTDALVARIPGEIEGVPVRIEETGEIRPLGN
jgi:hypothetical protein